MCIFAGFKHLACPRNRVILSVYDKSFGNLGVVLSYRYAIYLLRGADGFERDIGKNGDDGEKSTSHANNYRQGAHTTSSQGGKKEERLPDFRLPIGRCRGSNPHPCTAPIPFCTSEWWKIDLSCQQLPAESSYYFQSRRQKGRAAT